MPAPHFAAAVPESFCANRQSDQSVSRETFLSDRGVESDKFVKKAKI
jgi:hypothetical protein